MNFLLIFIVSLSGSLLTFFSGFGLGTILLPVFLIFFEPQLAVLATALVHFSNSIFKFILIFKHIHLNTLLRFGIPAVVASFFGAQCLKLLSGQHILYSYTLFKHQFQISGIGFSIGLLIIIFTWFENNKKLKNIDFKQDYLIFGGLLSGFFGGLSGHQGALRSLFLKKTSLSKEAFVGTSSAISLGIDLVRIASYLQVSSLVVLYAGSEKFYILSGIIGALIGALAGRKLLQKTSLDMLHRVVSIMLFVFGLFMMAGII